MDPETPEHPRAGCMECKAPRPYTVEEFPNSNTGWRCTVCGKILRLIPGNYTARYGLDAGEGLFVQRYEAGMLGAVP